MELLVVTDRGEKIRVPIDATTRIGDVAATVAHRVSKRSNVRAATIHYKGSLVPFNLRACALPEGAVVNFSMPLSEPAYDDTSRALSPLSESAWPQAVPPSSSTPSRGSSATSAHRAPLVSRQTLLLQLPDSQAKRRVHVDLADPIRILRETLDIPKHYCIHYNKRPILDEARSIESLRLSDRYLLTFHPYRDQSYLTATAVSVERPVSALKPPSQRDTVTLSELRSPKRFRTASSAFEASEGGGIVGGSTTASRSVWSVRAPQEQAQPVRFSFRGGESAVPASDMRASEFAIPPPGSSYLRPASVADRSPGAQPTPHRILFNDGQAPSSAKRTGANGYRGFEDNFSDIRARQSSSVADSSPYLSQGQRGFGGGGAGSSPFARGGESAFRPSSRAAFDGDGQFPARGGASSRLADESFFSFTRPPSSLNGGTPNAIVSAQTLKLPHASQSEPLRIFVSDPEDNGFTHDIEVNPDRRVSSLFQFVENPQRYVLCCDSVKVPNVDQVTFREVTRGIPGALFTFAAVR